MRINLSQVFSFTDNQKDVKAFNLYPYPISALEIYFVCPSTALSEAILAPVLEEVYVLPTTPVPGKTYYDVTNDLNATYVNSAWDLKPGINKNAKVVLEIDGIFYPIKNGLQGESPTNPIIFRRAQAFSKLHVYSSLATEYDLIGGPTVADWEAKINTGYDIEDANNISANITIGTNTPVDDFVLVKFKISEGLLGAKKYFSFGGAGLNDTAHSSNTVIEADKDGFGGAINTMGTLTAIEAYGGIVPDAILQDTIFVIQQSTYSEIESMKFTHATSGYGMNGYGGIANPDAMGYGGAQIGDLVGEVNRGVRY